MEKSKRIRVPTSDEGGYNREVIVQKRYVVVWDNCWELPKRIFTDLIEAKELYEVYRDQNSRVEEFILFGQIKTVFPE